MDTATIVLLITTCLLAIAVILLSIIKWRTWNDSERAAVASQLMAIAKTVAESLKDNRVDAGELKAILNQIVALISTIIKQEPNAIESGLTRIEQIDEYEKTSTADY